MKQALPVGSLVLLLVRLFLVSENKQLAPPLGRVFAGAGGELRCCWQPEGRTVSLPAVLMGNKQSVVSPPMVCRLLCPACSTVFMSHLPLRSSDCERRRTC